MTALHLSVKKVLFQGHTPVTAAFLRLAHVLQGKFLNTATVLPFAQWNSFFCIFSHALKAYFFLFFFFYFSFNHRRQLYHPDQKLEAAVHPLCLVFIFMNCASCLLEWLTPSNSCKHASHICFYHADYLMYNFNSSCVVEFFSICTSLKLCIMPVPAEHSSHEFHCMRYDFVFVHTRITAMF